MKLNQNPVISHLSGFIVECKKPSANMTEPDRPFNGTKRVVLNYHLPKRVNQRSKRERREWKVIGEKSQLDLG